MKHQWSWSQSQIVRQDQHEVRSYKLDVLSRTPNEICEEQLKDGKLEKVICCFESNYKDVSYANWAERGYLMNQDVLYRYTHECETEEAQLIVLLHERNSVLKEHHDVN